MPQDPQPLNSATSAIACAHCQRSNPAERKFCASCGKPLWEPCLICGELCGAGEAFCGSCGVSLSAAIEARCHEMDRACQEASTLAARHLFDEACARLDVVTHLDDHRLAEAAQRVEELRGRIIRQRDAGESLLQMALQAAELCLLTRDYEGVVQALEEVPDALLHEKAAKMLRDARNNALEVAALTEVVEEGLSAPEGKDVYELLDKADRLLRLKPEDERFQDLKERLQQLQLRTIERDKVRLCQGAKEQLIRFDYDAALRLLEQIPLTARTPELDRQIDLLSELAWLKWDLHNAPVIDATLLGVAERLMKLKPEDRGVAQTVATLQVRARAGNADRCKAAPAWVKAPEQTAVGCPVDWLGGFRRLEGPGLASDAVRQHVGCFYVAAGLALQGLGAAPLRINLLPQKRGLLGMGGDGKDRQAGDCAWGLDISSSGIKAMRLSWSKGREQAIVEACDFLEFGKPLSRPDGELEWRVTLQQALATFLSRNDVKGARICAAFSRPRVLGRFFRLPPLDSKKKVAELVRYEAAQQIPYDLDELCWDYEALADTAADDSWASRRVVLIAAKRQSLEERIELCREAGLKLHVVQSDCAALHNLLHYDFFGSEAAAHLDDDGAVVALDVGCDTLHLLFSTRRSAWFRTANFGSDDLTAALARTFQLTFDQAERLKRQPLTGRRLYQVDQAAQSVRDEFLAEIQRTVESYLKIHPEVSIQQMFALGGGMQAHGLLRHLRIGK